MLIEVFCCWLFLRDYRRSSFHVVGEVLVVVIRIVVIEV